MGTNAILADEVLTSNEVLKLSALVYLQDALVKQKYEQCAELVDIAVKFGADKGEIKQVIADYLQGKNGAKPAKNRLSLKETK
jgi:hypothetical protein